MPYFTADELRHAAKTVVDMAAYLDELKAAARSFADKSQISERGYFTASEDDNARRLLHSYWTSRNALFELICEYRRRVGDLSSASNGEFLVPFAAALLLIDAARFLRELAENNPVVRRKFNEPAPTLGIPGGTYDTVQRSLLSGRNAWHLFHAAKFYEQKRDAFLEAQHGDGMLEVLQIIETLRHRLDVSLSRFAKSKLRTRGDQWLRHIGRSSIVRALYGLQKLAASLMADVYVRPGHVPSIPDAVRNEFLQHLIPGDVLLVRKEYAITNYFLPGYWPHVALYLGDATDIQSDSNLLFQSRIASCVGNAQEDTNARRCVLESMKDGVLVRPIANPFASDSIIAIRPRLTDEEKKQAIRNALTHAGKPYDFDFDFRRSDRIVCTEVVYRGYEGVGSIRFNLVMRAGRPTLSGQDLVEMSLRNEFFEPVLAYVPAREESPQTDQDRAKSLIVETTKDDANSTEM